VRLIVAPLVLLAILAVAWTYVATGNPLGVDLLLLALGGIAGFELARLLLPGRIGFEHLLAGAACALLSGIGLLAPGSLAERNLWRLGLLAAALLLLLARHWRDVGASAVDRIARGLLPLLYVGLLFTWMREIADGPGGAERLIWVMLISKSSDIGGWLVGKPFGRHKLVPRVSPGKSWEGLAGGLLASTLVAVLLAAPLQVPEAAWSGVTRALFGLALGLVSVLAGITQSGWKRRLEAKDSSRLIPEMGGVLDMLDSLLFAAPVAWVWLEIAGHAAS
jgi:phosphatidate cytidylyltransferase